MSNLFHIITRFLIPFTVILQHTVIYSLSFPPNCLDYRKDEKFELPVVRIYDASDDIPNYENNGTVILKKPKSDRDTFGWIGLECSHTKPVRWVYNLDFGGSGLGDSYSQTAREVTDFYDATTYQFKADVELKIHYRKQTYVLSCMAFENPCERRFVQAAYDFDEELYVLKFLNKFEENQTVVQGGYKITLISDLENAVAKNANWGQQNEIASNNSDASCDVTFSLTDLGNSYRYLFQPSKTHVHPRTLPDRQIMENSYLFTEHLNRGCINDFCRHSDTAACFSGEKDLTALYLPVVFFMKDKNVSRVVHTYHTLISRKQQNGPGMMKFAWEYSDPKDFLEMESLPMKVAKGETITINCNVSPFLFSFGTKIGFQSSASSSTSQINFTDDVEEPPDFGAVRVASVNFTFPLTSKNAIIKMFCVSPVWNSSTEWVNISRQFELIESHLEVHRNNTGNITKVLVLPLNSFFTTSCSASGTPVPTLRLVPPNNITSITLNEFVRDDFKQINITINNIDETHQGVYNCVATNARGVEFYQFEIKVKGLHVVAEHPALSTLTIALISAFGSVSAIFLAVVIVLLVRFRMEKEEFIRLTEQAVREFFEGLQEPQVPSDDGGNQQLYANDGVKNIPYDRKFEVSHKHWSFTGTMLGSGAFGVVRKGFVEVGSRKSIIAIKTVRSNDDIDDFRATLLELKIMSSIGHHRHIVRLIAASTDEINNRKVFIGVEFCANGSLLTYLQKRKKLFTNLVKDGQMLFQVDDNKDNDSREHEGLYTNLVTSDISTIDLYKWCFQIASGMDFLESRKVLHADLAARNILLTEDLLVKISDFGLSRELFENSEYMKKTQVALPWKWMAIESLRFLKFTIKSDVWSYGVVLYEVFTLGEEPYPMQTWNEEFILTLESGMRLGRPPFCTDNVYTQVMMKCWQEEPNDRIRFADAMAFFEMAIGLLTSSPRNRDECRDFC